MTKLKSTKRALTMSAVSLLLCFTMLLGTTFAWFTDSATSANNIIQTGNLDIVLEYYNGTEWKNVEGSDELLDAEALWEPGHTEVVYLRMRNAGTLALKYQFGINIVSEKTGTNKAGETFSLSDYIYFDVADGVNGQTNPYATREDAMAIATNNTKISAGYNTAEVLNANSEFEYFAVVVYMPTTVTNVANHNGVDIPHINLGVNILATQATVEGDSFGTTYDKDAWMEGMAVYTADDLQAALKAGGTVKLENDIELTEPIVVPAAPATFSMRAMPNATILNLNGKTLTGTMHKSVGSVIKNDGILHICNGTISSTAENGGSAISNSGILTVENVTLNGAPNANGSWPSYTINNTGETTLTNCNVTSYHGAIASYGEGALVTIDNINVNMRGIPGFTSHALYTYSAGKIVVNSGYIANNATDQNNTRASVINGYVEVFGGTFVGRIENYYGTPSIKGGSFTVDPSRFATQDVMVAPVDGGYVVLPSGSFEKISNGLYYNSADKSYYVASAAGLATMNTMMANKTVGYNTVVALLGDIDFTGYTWTPVDSHSEFGFSLKEFDGQGHTIYNLTVNGQAMFTRFAGSGDVVIKDITFDGATINSTDLNTSILTVQTYQNTLLDNVDVKNSSITGAYKVAPLIATVYNEKDSSITATLKNCDVSNTTVTSTSFDFCTCGLVSFVYTTNNDYVEYENCSITDVQLRAVSGGYNYHANIHYTSADTDDQINEHPGVTVTNVTFTQIG